MLILLLPDFVAVCWDLYGTLKKYVAMDVPANNSLIRYMANGLIVAIGVG